VFIKGGQIINQQGDYKLSKNSIALS